MTTESTPVTIHTHTRGTTTFVSGTPNEIQTLASDQAGDAVLGMAVLADGTSVVLSATVGLFHYQYDNYDNRTAGYSSVQVTTIDDGVATTNTLSLGSPDDTSGGVNPNLAGRGTSAETGTQPASDFLDRENFAEDMQIVALSGGGYVIDETTVDDNIGPVNGNLYFAVFNSSGQPINSSGQVVGSPDWTLVNTVDPPNNPDNFYTNPNNDADASENDDYQLVATPTGGFAIQWAENDEINGYFERFTSTGTSAASIVNYDNANLTTEFSTLGGGFAVDTNGDIAIAIPTSEDVYTPNSLAIYNSSDTQILNETWQAADGGLVPVISNPGHSGVDPINAESSPEFQALPSGGFLAVVSDPTGPWNTQSGYPDIDYYLQRITVSGSTVTFDTPVLIGDDLVGTPVVLSNGDILLGISNGTTTTNEIFHASQLPSTNTGMASSTPASLTPLTLDTLLPVGTSIVSAVSDNNDGVLVALQSGTVTQYYGTLDASLYAADMTPCYCPGTLIRTPRGQKKVEKLKIGDKVMTASGEARRIKWIGRRSYSGRFVMGRKDVLPVCIKAGALEDNVPKRDLWISPNHAMYLDGVLIEAKDLVNGGSIVQAESAESIEYYHVELDTHDVLIAEGALAESYIDDDNRLLFHNAHEYREKYPDQEIGPAQYYAPRCDSGYELETVRQRIALRAGLVAGDAAPPIGNLRGFVDRITSECVSGWAQNLDHPEAPVCLDVVAGGLLLGQVLACGYREDLKQAGMGSGHHSFEFALPPEIVVAADEIEVLRSLDGTALELTIEAWRMLRQNTSCEREGRRAVA